MQEYKSYNTSQAADARNPKRLLLNEQNMSLQNDLVKVTYMTVGQIMVNIQMMIFSDHSGQLPQKVNNSGQLYANLSNNVTVPVKFFVKLNPRSFTGCLKLTSPIRFRAIKMIYVII